MIAGGEAGAAEQTVEESMRLEILTALATALLATAAHSADATADIVDREGNNLGAVRVHDTASGLALATLTLSNLPEGQYAVHLHETGDCESEDFSSAGGHIAGDRQHGVLAEGGPHPGDMPNVSVAENGIAQVEVVLPFLDVERQILDDDGAAFVIHAGIDDYETQPSGNAGDRMACGVFSQR